MIHLLARLLVASPVAEVRDGPRGLDLAMAALRQGQSTEFAQTVAMAYAELGRFDEAVSWQRRVIEEVHRGGSPEQEAAARRLLAHYERDEPCRAPWKNG